MSIRIQRDIDDRRYLDVRWRGRCLRAFARPWRWWPYREFRWGLWIFGVGCVGCMFWPKRHPANAQ